MFRISRKSAQEKIVAVIDIGSGSAGIAVTAVGETGLAKILIAERRVLPFEERVTAATITSIGQNLSEIGEKVLASYAQTEQKERGPITSVYCVIRAPWTRSKTVHATSVFEKPQPITEKIIASVAQDALKTDTEMDRQQLLEATVIRVELNEYPAPRPEGRWAQKIKVLALVSDCDASVRSMVEEAATKLFNQPHPQMRSGTRALLSILRSKSLESRSYLIVDMASEGTNLVVMRDGVTDDHIFISEGKHSILKRITKTGMPEDTLSILKMIARDECSDSTCTTIQTAMAETEPELVRVFGDAMGKLAATRRLPNNLVLATHGDLVPWLAAFFGRIDFSQFTATTQPFLVDALVPADFAQWIAPTAGLDVDTGLSIAVALVNIENQES